MRAARGHDVTLYEKSGSLGGQLTVAGIVKGPHENLGDLKSYLVRQMDIHGVKVVLNTEADAQLIGIEAPDALILAVGALPGSVSVSGGSVPVLDYGRFMGP